VQQLRGNAGAAALPPLGNELREQVTGLSTDAFGH
jgi:hypothetical protein